MTEVIPNKEKELEALYHRFTQRLDNVFYNKTERELFLLAFVEAVNNAAEHGNKNNPDKHITVNYSLKKDFASVSVMDEGTGFYPVFPNLKEVRGKRGRGLGFIKSNTDAIFFNKRGNKIFFLKGGKIMNTFENINATVKILPNDGVILVEIEPKADKRENKPAFADGIVEIFESLDAMKFKRKKILFNLQKVRILTSTAWGAFFAEVERDDIDTIYLFNANNAIMTVATQSGVFQQNGSFAKLKVLPNDTEVIDILEAA